MKDVLEKFISSFPITKGNKKQPYIILFDAYTGMGKSTVSKTIQKYDNSIILNNDEVRYFLNDYQDKSNLKNKLQLYRLEKLLENNNSCIFDSCFCHNYKEKLVYFNKLGYKYYIIKLKCREEIIKERLSKRILDKNNYSIATFEDYLWMKENIPQVPDELIDYIINTEENIDDQVIEFLNNIN